MSTIATFGRCIRDVPEQVVRRSRLRDDVEARVGQEPCDPLAQQHRVVRQHDADAGAERRDGVSKRWEVAREVVGEQLVDSLGLREALQPILAEIAARDAVERVQQLVRHDDLPAVSGVRDPRRANDVEPV